MSAYGKGRTLMLGSYVSASFQSTPTPEVKRFYNALLAWAGVSRPVGITGTPIEVRFLQSEARLKSGPTATEPRATLLFLFNHRKQRSASQVLVRNLRGPARATDLADDKPFSMTFSGEGATIAAAIEPFGVRVLRIENQ
jgi:hypothetical protein